MADMSGDKIRWVALGAGRCRFLTANTRRAAAGRGEATAGWLQATLRHPMCSKWGTLITWNTPRLKQQ